MQGKIHQVPKQTAQKIPNLSQQIEDLQAELRSLHSQIEYYAGNVQSYSDRIERFMGSSEEFDQQQARNDEVVMKMLKVQDAAREVQGKLKELYAYREKRKEEESAVDKQ